MTASTNIVTYLGEGTHAARPSTPSLPTGGLAVYYETDTLNTFIYDLNTAAWVQVNGAGGAQALISSLTASASADLHWTGLASQTSWKLVGRLIVPTTANHGIGLVVGTGAGPTYITTGYHVMVQGHDDGNSAHTAGATNNANISFDVGDCGSAPGNSFDATILTDNATYLTIMGSGMYKNNGGNFVTTNFAASVAISAAITAIKIVDDHGGTLASGVASLYSLVH